LRNFCNELSAALPRRLRISRSVTANLAPFANKSFNAARVASARTAQPEIESSALMIGEAFSLTTAHRFNRAPSRASLATGSRIQPARQGDQLTASSMGRCIEEFLKYLKMQHAQLSRAYPEFGGDRTGASFVIGQIESALRFVKEPHAASPRQLNPLDE
jgi:hypothetical protein